MDNTVGIVGLGTMGFNLALNFKDHGFKPYGHDLDEQKVAIAKEKGIESFTDLEEMIRKLKHPRVLIVLVPAAHVDTVLSTLHDLLDPTDIVIDGGNSNWRDTERRIATFNRFKFLGMGISGGADGARHGPSLMPGGDKKTYFTVEPMLQSIAASFEGEPCCLWMGNGGAGHFVKMVHNGIEYADMELISETYDFLRRFFSNEAIADIFARWNEGALQSFLLEASSHILRDKHGDSFVVDDIIDEAGQKGTGKWTAITALELGVPLNVIAMAVNQRFVSSYRLLRTDLSENYSQGKIHLNEKSLIEHLENALLFGRIMAYAEGVHLLKEADRTMKWGLDLTSAISVWRAGCIIRSQLLHPIIQSLAKDPDHLLQSSEIAVLVRKTLPSTILVIHRAISMGVPVPCLSAALETFYSFIASRLPANLIQAQRDYFGSHGFKTFSDPDHLSHWQWKKGED